MQFEPPPDIEEFETKEKYDIAFKKWKKALDKAMNDFESDYEKSK